MSRTLKGNLTGCAARGHDELDETPLTRTNQDVRIGRKIKQLSDLMPKSGLMEFYITTSNVNDLLEKQLDDKISELIAAEAQAVIEGCEEEPHPLFTAADERDEQMNRYPEVSL